MSPCVGKETPRVLVVGNGDGEGRGWTEALRSTGLQVELEPDLERALLIAADIRPSAIVLDLTMPGSDSLQLAAALRSDARTRDAVVIALAPAVGLDVVALAQLRGCDAVVSVGSRAHVLAAVVVRAIARRARRRASDVSAA